MLEAAKAMLNEKAVIILSNGTFLYDPVFTLTLLSFRIPIQITNDSRFYPKPLPAPLWQHPLLHYTEELSSVQPFGRAIKNKVSFGKRAPYCFNLRSIHQTSVSFGLTILKLRSLGKECTPSINIDGSIVAGEAPDCEVIGNVFDTSKLHDGLLNLKCDKCGLSKNLPSSKHKEFWEKLNS
jgi:hypothetical protein